MGEIIINSEPPPSGSLCIKGHITRITAKPLRNTNYMGEIIINSEPPLSESLCIKEHLTRVTEKHLRNTIYIGITWAKLLLIPSLLLVNHPV
jgi:hypothetical protein